MRCPAGDDRLRRGRWRRPDRQLDESAGAVNFLNVDIHDDPRELHVDER